MIGLLLAAGAVAAVSTVSPPFSAVFLPGSFPVQAHRARSRQRVKAHAMIRFMFSRFPPLAAGFKMETV